MVDWGEKKEKFRAKSRIYTWHGGTENPKNMQNQYEANGHKAQKFDMEIKVSPRLVIYHQYNLRFFILCFTMIFYSKKLDNFFLFLLLNFTLNFIFFMWIILLLCSWWTCWDWQHFNENKVRKFLSRAKISRDKWATHLTTLKCFQLLRQFMSCLYKLRMENTESHLCSSLSFYDTSTSMSLKRKIKQMQPITVSLFPFCHVCLQLKERENLVWTQFLNEVWAFHLI